MTNMVFLIPVPGRDFPFGYLLAALFLIAAIVLFVISIFMQDKNAYDDYDDGYGDYDEGYSNYNLNEEIVDVQRDTEESVMKRETAEIKNLIIDEVNEINELEEIDYKSDIEDNKVDENTVIIGSQTKAEPSKFDTQVYAPPKEVDNQSDMEHSNESGGLSFADEVKRLIEEEKRNKAERL